MSSVNIPGPPERFNFAQYLLQLNQHRSGKLAVVDDASELTYGGLFERVRLMAAALRSLGLRREERVLLLMQDGAEWPVSFLGAIYAGLVPVAVNTLLTAEDYAYMLAHSRSQAVLTSGVLLSTLRRALVSSGHEVRQVVVVGPCEPLVCDEIEFESFLQAHDPLAHATDTNADDPAFWLYSSGTTGRPKGTVHCHANPYWTIELYGKRILGMTESDVVFSAAKLFFAYGLGNSLSFPFGVGATSLLMAQRSTPEAIFERWLGGVRDTKPTLFFGAPTVYAGILGSPQAPSREGIALRLASSAGEALPANIGHRFRARFGVDIVDGIGSTEMLHIFISNRPDQVSYGTTGWPVPGYDIELRGENGLPVPDGEVGDLFVRGPSAALMYWGNRQRTRETFLGAWTRSGDKYTRNPDGSLTCSGRTDDMLKVSGIYVSPFEVEGTLVEHPAVLEAAVIGVPDADGLVKTKAFVVLKEGFRVDEAELKAFVKDHLAPYKYPRSIEFLSELPKTATGKVQRFLLRQREAQRR